ncbi:MAG: NAD(P)-dependent oxidoreductase [Pseudomonadota bacterium]
MAKVLIAGGTGFVGMNAARMFAAAGVPVVITSRKRRDASGEALAAENALVSIEYLNLERGAEVFELLSRHRFTGMVMLAHAHQYARTRAASNAIYPMTLNCLEAARLTGVQRIVLASSKAIYGGLKPPFNEDARFPMKVSYAGTVEEELKLPHVPEFETTVKRAVELMAFDYSIPMPAPTSGLQAATEEKAMDVVALRFPIQWGPGYSAMGNPFSLVTHAAAGRIDSLAGRTGYFGSSVVDLWNQFSGAPTSFVRDSASAVTTAMLADSLPHPVYNVSSGFHESAREQLELLYGLVPDSRQRIGIDPEDLAAEAKPDVGFNADRLNKDFGWVPAHRTIGDAYEEYLSWLQRHAY